MIQRARAYTLLRRNLGTVLSLLLSVTLFGIAIAWSFDIPVSQNTSEVGPRFFPLLGAVGGMVLCGVLLCQLIRRKTESDTDQRIPLAALKAGMLIVAYVVLMRQTGFYFASIIIIPSLMLVGGERRWPLLLMAVLGLCLFTYFFFEVSLNIVFPTGWWSD